MLIAQPLQLMHLIHSSHIGFIKNNFHYLYNDIKINMFKVVRAYDLVP